MADFFMCGVRINGTVACWGNSERGETNVPAGTFVSVSAGAGFACAVRTDGTLACWGNDHYATAAPDGTFSSVSAGSNFACAVRTDGTLACWPSFQVVSTPPSGTFTSVSAGLYYAYAVRTDGTLACWGNELSDPTPTGTFTSVSASEAFACAVQTDRHRCLLGHPAPGHSRYLHISQCGRPICVRGANRRYPHLLGQQWPGRDRCAGRHLRIGQREHR